MVNISLAKLIRSVNKRSSNLVKGMLEGISFLINQKDDKYRRTLEKKKKKKNWQKRSILMTLQTMGPMRSLVCYNYPPEKLQPLPNPSKAHLSCRREQPSVYFQLTAWHFLTTHRCPASNILLPPWVSINRNTVVLALLIRLNSCLPSHTETQNCFA